VLERCGRLPAEYATNILLDVCDAVGEAHGLGIVHRDLKPANIFIHRRANSTTVTKVLDFGISKVHVPNQQELTLTSAFMGSPRYMSPEQLRDPRNVTGRADIWALGVTLYELLTGVPPFVSNSFARMATLIMTVDPEPMRTKRVDLPEALDALVMRCLSKDPEARFATAQDLAAALRAVHFEAPEAAPPSSLPTPLEQQATHFAEVDQVAIPPAGTLLGLDSPKDLAQGRAEPSRLRVSLAVGAAILVGGAAFGATTLISSEAPSSLGSQGLPQPSSLGASAPPAAVVLVEAAAPPPPQTETDGPQSSASPANSALPSKPRRARMPVPSARPSDPFDLPLAR
jgi:serine/threonine protein kinase